MNLRQAITRNITYTEVFVEHEQNGEGMQDNYFVYGETTPIKEMKKILKNPEVKGIPKIVCVPKTEKRAISIEDFIKYSEIISDEEREKTNNEC